MRKKEKTKIAKRNPIQKLKFHSLDWLEYVALIVGFWFLFYPHPYQILFVLNLLLPILGLVLNGLNGRPSIATLVEIDKDFEGDEKYDFADFIVFPALVLAYRVVRDFEFEDFYSLIIPGLITFIAVFAILISTHKIFIETKKSKVWITLAITGNLFLYSYASTYGLNCVFDSSKPQKYKVEILDKRIHVSHGRRGRTTTYYFKLAPWGHHHDTEEVSVESNQYQRFKVGNKVTIELSKGLFGIPWYRVKEHHVLE